MAKLQIITDKTNKEIIELTRNNYILGRGEKSNIRLTDVRSSRQHAKIFSQDNNYYIQDIGSANGTILNGNKIKSNTACLLSNNDIIKIGQTKITISEIPEIKTSLTHKNIQKKNEDDLIFDASQFELTATLDASINLTQTSEKDSLNFATMSKAIKRMEAMCIIAEAVGNIIDINELMDKVIETVFNIFPKAERSFIVLKENKVYKPVAVRSKNNLINDLKGFKISTTVLNICTEKKMSFLSNNISKDERFNSAQSISNLQIRSLICSPLIINNEVLGIIQVEKTTNNSEFDETDLQILTGISGQIAIAVKNISLVQEIKKESAQRSNLERYFSPNIAEMLLNGNISTELGGKEYTGTIFFSDIIGFTSMSEKLNAKDVVKNLNYYFNIMQNIIYKNKGNVDKFGGDAIMAFWSVPKYQKTDEFNAVLTGIQMQNALYPLNIDFNEISAIYMGVGINTGNFIAGNIGSEEKIEFTLIGDNVNLAARIEAKAGKTQVLCSEETYNHISSLICSVKLPKTHFKGKSTEQHIYSIRGIMINSEKMLTNIPVRITSNDNQQSNNFHMIKEIKNFTDNTNKEIILIANQKLPLSSEIKLKCCLNEYHECIKFSGAINNIVQKKSLTGIEYYEYTINNIRGDKFLEIFTPSFCYETKLSWDKMPREREVEGN